MLKGYNRNMETNLFERIFKYKETEKRKPLENYCTEIFVYIIEQLLLNNSISAIKILNLFGIKNYTERKLKNIKLSTRNQYVINKSKLIPDIEIKYGKKRLFIEVKINSGLNYYKDNKKIIDQLARYKMIDNKNNVYSLTKFINNSPAIENNQKVLWSQIYELLENENNEIIKNFLLFLKEHGMEKYNPVGNGVSSALQKARDLWYLIGNSWPQEYSEYELKDTFCADYIGYWIKFKKKLILWIGQTFESKLNDYIVIEITDNSFIKKLKKQNVELPDETDENENIIFSKIDLKIILKEKSESKQRKILNDWIRKNIEKLKQEYK
jgi:hypothetical protein